MPCILESIIRTIAVLASWETEFRPMIPMEIPNNWNSLLTRMQVATEENKKKVDVSRYELVWIPDPSPIIPTPSAHRPLGSNFVLWSSRLGPSAIQPYKIVRSRVSPFVVVEVSA